MKTSRWWPDTQAQGTYAQGISLNDIIVFPLKQACEALPQERMRIDQAPNRIENIRDQIQLVFDKLRGIQDALTKTRLTPLFQIDIASPYALSE
nr:hypothetical protein [Rhizobium rhizogenes]